MAKKAYLFPFKTNLFLFGLSYNLNIFLTYKLQGQTLKINYLSSFFLKKKVYLFISY